MNIKDFTLKLAYKLNGKEHCETVEYAALAEGFSNGVIALKEDGGEGRVKITLTATSAVELTLAEVIYGHYFETGDAVFVNGYQSWTTSREYKHGEQQYGLSAICKLPIARDYAGSSGDYHFTQYAKDLYHSFTYTYIRNGAKTELIGSLNERTGYTIFYADMRENVFAAVKDIDGLTVLGEYEIFDFMYAMGSYDEVFDRYFEAYPLKSEAF